MVKPIMNLDDIAFDDVEDNGFYTSRRGTISGHIGARALGYNLTILPPGKAQCPFHCHHGEEEMFLILEGEGELRFGDARYPIRRHDVIACPPGGPEVAHQIINTGTTQMRYLSLSTVAELDACEYPTPEGECRVGPSRPTRAAQDLSCRGDGRLLRPGGALTAAVERPALNRCRVFGAPLMPKCVAARPHRRGTPAGAFRGSDDPLTHRPDPRSGSARGEGRARREAYTRSRSFTISSGWVIIESCGPAKSIQVQPDCDLTSVRDPSSTGFSGLVQWM